MKSAGGPSCGESPLRPILAVKSLFVRLIVGGRDDIGDMFSVGDKQVRRAPLVAGCRASTLLVSSGRMPVKGRFFESDRKFHACDPSRSEPEPDILSVFDNFAVPFELFSRSLATSGLMSFLETLSKAQIFFSQGIARELEAPFFLGSAKVVLCPLVNERGYIDKSARVFDVTADRNRNIHHW